MTDCLFCQISARKLPASIEYEDPDILIIRDIQPQAPNHVLVIPRRHIERISSLEDKDAPLAGALIYKARRFAADRGWTDYRLVFNNGPQAGQTVYHIHLHLLNGRFFSWPPG